MPSIFNFEQLVTRLNFNTEQLNTLSQRIRFTPKEYYHALNTLINANIVETLTPEIVSACVDTVITENESPEYMALIISELAAIEALSTLERTQIYLTNIKNAPQKAELHAALSWLNILGLPNEMIQHYFLSDHIEESNYKPAIIRQIAACFSMLASAGSKQLRAMTSLVKLLKHAYSLPYDDHIQLIHKVCSHQNIDELNKALEILCSSTLFEPFTTRSELCLNAVLQDQQTPEATASMLKLIFAHDAHVSEKLTQNYCIK